MQLPYSEDLEIQYLSRLFDNTSECYKFFWFQAIVTKDLLARAGYALSQCDKQDVIFTFFIENEIFDMFEIDIALEEHVWIMRFNIDRWEEKKCDILFMP